MAQAARAIIIENDQLLVMFRNKFGSQYYTLVGGKVDEGETVEQAVSREVMEETGLQVTRAELVFIEQHPAPYNEQYIYLCEVAPHGPVGIQLGSEEELLNQVDLNVHTPLWVSPSGFDKLPFRTPQLQLAILEALKKGFPAEPTKL